MYWASDMHPNGVATSFFTARTLAERWQVSVRTVRRLIHSKQITIHRVGRQVRIARVDVIDFERGTRELVDSPSDR